MRYIGLLTLIFYSGIGWGQSCQEIVYSQIKRVASSHKEKIYVQREPLIVFQMIKREEICIKNNLSEIHNKIAPDIDTSKLEIKMESVLFNCPFYSSYKIQDKNIVLFQEKDLFKMYGQNKRAFDKISHKLTLVTSDTFSVKKIDIINESIAKFNRDVQKAMKPIYRFSIPIHLNNGYLIIFYDKTYYPGYSEGHFSLLKYNKENKEIKFIANLCGTVS